MASVAEVGNVAGGARYIDNCLNTQSYRVRKYIFKGGKRPMPFLLGTGGHVVRGLKFLNLDRVVVGL